MQVIFLASQSELAVLASRMVAAVLAAPELPAPSYSSTRDEAFVKSAAAAPSIPALPTLSRPGPVGASFTFPGSLVFTVGLSKEASPSGPCLHLSMSARGLVGPVESPPEDELARVAAAFSPEMRKCPPEGALSFVHHFRAPAPPGPVPS